MTDLKLEVLTKAEFLEQYPNINLDLTDVDNVAVRQEDGVVSFSTKVTVDGKPLEEVVEAVKTTKNNKTK